MLIEYGEVSLSDTWQCLQQSLNVRAVWGSAKKDEQKAIHFHYFGKY